MSDQHAPDETGEDYLTIREARELLGISKMKMTQLIRDGAVPTYDSLLDKRVKMLRRGDVERLARTVRPRKPVRAPLRAPARNDRAGDR